MKINTNNMKYNAIILFFILLPITGCRNSVKKESKQIKVEGFNVIDSNQIKCNIDFDSIKSTINSKSDLPFIGERTFRTRAGENGKSQPILYIKIKQNRDVYFYYEQTNFGDDNHPTIKSKYYSGKFKQVLKCDFSDVWEGLTRYYVVTKEKIYETDKNGMLLRLEDCCGIFAETPDSICDCVGETH